MTAFKRQIPDLKYDLDIRSDSNAKYNGTFTKFGKTFDLRGCCIYKKTNPARVWAILTFYPKDNPEAQAAGQRAIDSVVFNGSTEECEVSAVNRCPGKPDVRCEVYSFPDLAIY